MSDTPKLSTAARIHNARLDIDLDLSDLPGGETGDVEATSTIVPCDDCGDTFDRENEGSVLCPSCKPDGVYFDPYDCMCDDCISSDLVPLKDHVFETTKDEVMQAVTALRDVLARFDYAAYGEEHENAVEALMDDVFTHVNDLTDTVSDLERHA